MNRRNFLTGMASAVTLPVLLDGFTTQVLAQSPMLDRMMDVASATDRILVLIQLSGGNDGINTLIPLDQLSTYYAIRRSIALPENTIVRLTDRTGLHPAFAPMKSLYDDGKLTIIQGVSYPSVNQSHFRSTDIWFTASDADQYVNSGWLGRFTNQQAPEYPRGFPNANNPDPLAIEIGGAMSLTLQGFTNPMGITIRDLTAFENLLAGGNTTTTNNDVPNTRAGNRIRFIRNVQAQSQQYSSRIKAAAERARNRAEYPAKGINPLADQLQIVARLIAGGLQTRVYVVNLGGFDTHWDQTLPNDTTRGIHANLLGYLAQGITLFQRDIELLGLQHRVLGMTISEFGRRPATSSNGSDHGTAGPMFVFGSSVRGGMIGTNPSLTNLMPDGNLRMQYDFRQVYTSVLNQWFRSNEELMNVVMMRNFAQLPLVNTQTSVAASRQNQHSANSTLTPRNYPNPCDTHTTLEYTLPRSSRVRVRLLDGTGRTIGVMLDSHQAAGKQRVPLDTSLLPPGAYFCEVLADDDRAVNPFIVTR
jgi:uncharacterized protein (DUF1501 family)